jgi:NAD dependent epimerase/dehydratase family enzyme
LGGPNSRQAVLCLFGQMGEETILDDLKFLPAKLENLRFSYRFPNLEPALRHLLLENLPVPAIPPKEKP